MVLSTQVRLLRSVLGIYVSFITWGFFQERVTAVDYVSEKTGQSRRFKNVMVLNRGMGVAACIVGAICTVAFGEPLFPKAEDSTGKKPRGFLLAVSEVAFTNTIASPFGYAALNYISYPMLVLAKVAQKLLPHAMTYPNSRFVTLTRSGLQASANHVDGNDIRRQKVLTRDLLTKLMHRAFSRYKMIDFLSGLLITAGIALFSYKKGKESKTEDKDSNLQLVGLGLVFCNLLLDGYTNAKQEKMYKAYKNISSFHMMCFLNGWTAVLISLW